MFFCSDAFFAAGIACRCGKDSQSGCLREERCSRDGGWEEIDQSRQVVSARRCDTVMDQHRFETLFSGLLGMKAEEFIQDSSR